MKKYRQLILNSVKRDGLRPTAANIGIPVMTLQTYATGRSQPRMENLEILSDYFKIPITELFKDTDDPKGKRKDIIAQVEKMTAAQLESVQQFIKQILNQGQS